MERNQFTYVLAPNGRLIKAREGHYLEIVEREIEPPKPELHDKGIPQRRSDQ